MAECGFCGRVIPAGSTYIGIDDIAQMKDRIFCCKECAKASLANRIDEIYEEKAYEETMEDEDPYARYGVRRDKF